MPHLRYLVRRTALVTSFNGSTQRLQSSFPKAKNQRRLSIYGACGFSEPLQAVGDIKKETMDYTKAKPGQVDLQEELKEPMETESETSVNCSPIVSQERLFRAQATQDVYFVGIVETLVQKYSENSTKGPLSFLERMLREF